MAVQFSRFLMMLGFSAILMAASPTAHAALTAEQIKAVGQAKVLGAYNPKLIGATLVGAGYTPAQVGEMIGSMGLSTEQATGAFSGMMDKPYGGSADAGDVGRALKASGMSLSDMGAVISGLGQTSVMTDALVGTGLSDADLGKILSGDRFSSTAGIIQQLNANGESTQKLTTILSNTGKTPEQIAYMLSRTNLTTEQRNQITSGLTTGGTTTTGGGGTQIVTTPGVGSTGGGATTSSSSVSPTCDPKYFDSLKAKAWTEAQREIEQNQNYIYKADSVLQYTCFDKFLNTLAGVAPQLFSQNPSPWGPTGGNMQAALQNLISDSLSKYIGNNFNHSYLGDFSSLTSPATGSVSAGSYGCDQMKKVWTAAKCQDFANKATSNGKANTSADTDFFTIATYSGNDYRRYPSNSVCAPASTFANQLSVSTNAGSQYPKETFDVYAKFFKPTSCTAPGIIPTGVTVKRSGTSFPEIVCVAPGCAPNDNGTACQ